jgi:hypothetical protein
MVVLAIWRFIPLQTFFLAERLSPPVFIYALPLRGMRAD